MPKKRCSPGPPPKSAGQSNGCASAAKASFPTRKAVNDVTEAELALDENGEFLGLRVNTLANIGGYISTFGPNIPTNLDGPLLAGVYTDAGDLL